ncbi:MAG: Smr/MutS family protein [Myxococcota bacterium]
MSRWRDLEEQPWDPSEFDGLFEVPTAGGELDLHNFSPKDLRTLVPDWIAACRRDGVLQIRIVHGKGRGHLQRSVHALLSRDAGVMRFELADATRGSWGATLAWLHPDQGE